MNPQKKLKLILASLKDKQIMKYFQVFVSHFPQQFKKTIRQITFNCYEAVCEFKNRTATGYGKNSQQSYINGVRALIQMFADESKYHSILRQSMKIIQQSNLFYNNCESQKKLSTIDKINQSSMKNVSLHNSIKPNEKKITLKQEIFQYLNLDNLKISNPNGVHKSKLNQKPLAQYSYEEDQLTLEQVLKKNRQLQQKILQAKQENQKLKLELRIYKQNEQTTNINQENQMRSSSKLLCSQTSIKPRQSYEPLKTKTNEYINMGQDPKMLQKSKTRSVSVQANQTQKYMIPKGNDKKIAIPKLNLQVLPNYHGKSNKSLNQSLMENYEKIHAK